MRKSVRFPKKKRGGGEGESTPPLLWRRGLTIANITFTHSSLWVQVWGLPFKNTTDETGKDIGSRLLGTVIEVDKLSWKQIKLNLCGSGLICRLMKH